MAQESLSDLYVDDLYLAFLDQENQEYHIIFPVSDFKYAEELQLQEAFMASTITFRMTNSASASVADHGHGHGHQMEEVEVEKEAEPEPEPKPTEMSMEEAGESSMIFCEICTERKASDEMFRFGSCLHSYCSDCISKHVSTKLQDNIITVTCPGLDCKSVLELDSCKPVLPKGVVELWEEALCEELIDLSQRFYCPYKDCSAMLVHENEGGEVITSSECPICHRLFCAQCSVPWHSGIECEEYQRLNEDEKGSEDLMVRELAKGNKWGRCPNCKYYVERTAGCPHMICRCNFQFCYGCGSEWTPTHGGCSRP